MGFDPQNANEPIVNVHKRTTKVNIATVIAVAVFLIVGIASLRWFSARADHSESSPSRETIPAK